MLVRAHDGRIEHRELVVGIARQRLENTREHAADAPSAIAPVRRLPFAVARWQVAPRDTRAVAIDHGIDEQAIVRRVAADMALSALNTNVRLVGQ